MDDEFVCQERKTGVCYSLLLVVNSFMVFVIVGTD